MDRAKTAPQHTITARWHSWHYFYVPNVFSRVCRARARPPTRPLGRPGPTVPGK